MSDGRDKIDDGGKQAPPDASAALIKDTQKEMPAKVSDNTSGTGENTIAATPDYSKETPEVQARMNVDPAKGIATANENIAALTKSISNSPEGVKAAQDGVSGQC